MKRIQITFTKTQTMCQHLDISVVIPVLRQYSALILKVSVTFTIAANGDAVEKLRAVRAFNRWTES